jgi:hypothetical protein
MSNIHCLHDESRDALASEGGGGEITNRPGFMVSEPTLVEP